MAASAEPVLFITFEGLEGSGKSTQIRALVEHLRTAGRKVVATREPGGTGIGDEIRHVLHRERAEGVQPETELLLYSAARAQIVRQVIRPALESGAIVIADRYADSTLAYQGYGRGLDLATLRVITAFATGGLVPGLTFYLAVPVNEGLRRRADAHKREGEEWNRMDHQAFEFYERVRLGYEELIRLDPARWVCIDGMRSASEVQEDLRGRLAQLAGEENLYESETHHRHRPK